MAEDDSWADSLGQGVIITLTTIMNMPIAMTKAETTHQEVDDIKEEVGIAEQLEIITRQPQLVFAVVRPATWQTVAPPTYLQRLQKTESIIF